MGFSILGMGEGREKQGKGTPEEVYFNPLFSIIRVYTFMSEYKADKNPNVMDESDLDALPIWA